MQSSVHNNDSKAESSYGFMSDFATAASLLGCTRAGAEQKSEPNIEARLAAMYALEKIATRNDDAFCLAMETLCAYVRLNAAWDDENPPQRAPKDIPPDIQTALKVIGRCARPDVESLDFRADLTRTDLRGAVLWGAQLNGAILARVNFEMADLGEAQLAGASLMGANLSGAILWKANLESAQMWGANLQRASLAEADLSNANLTFANLQGAVLTSATLEGTLLTKARLQGTRLEGVSGLTEEQLKDAQLGDDAEVKATQQ